MGNPFIFKDDSEIVDTLNNHAGGFMQLHYKEYLHALPCRGLSSYVVESAYTVKSGIAR